MRSKPAYTECKLYYDGVAAIDVGHFLKTPAGSAYYITHMHQNRNRPFRRHLKCLRWPVNEIPEDAAVHPLYWYPRKKKRGVSVRELHRRAVA